MPTKLLPSIKEKLPLRKKAQKKKQELTQARNLSPNLLSPIETKSLIMKATPKIARSAKSLAIVTAIIYALFLIVNVSLQYKLDNYAQKRDEQLQTNNKYAYVEERIKEVSKVTKLYQDTKLQNQDVTESLTPIAKALAYGVDVESLSYDRDDLIYEMEVSAPRATTFAILIQNILESEHVKSVTIEYVIYISSSQDYSAGLEVAIK